MGSRRQEDEYLGSPLHRGIAPHPHVASADARHLPGRFGETQRAAGASASTRHLNRDLNGSLISGIWLWAGVVIGRLWTRAGRKELRAGGVTAGARHLA
jgi:hypothetical protein